jgi:hypothetical protein
MKKEFSRRRKKMKEKRLNFIWSAVCLFILALTSAGTGAELAGAADQAALSESARPNHNLVFDFRLSMRSSTESILGIHHVVSCVEEKLIGSQWFQEKSFFGKAGGILLRLAKLYVFDLPQDYFSLVFAHEFSGHGGRYRELKIHDVDYGYDLPPPYGRGGGQASANLSAGQVSAHEHLAIWMGGLESQALMNRKLSLGWVERGEVGYREASLFFLSSQISAKYVFGSEENFEQLAHLNDVQAYIQLLNRSYGYLEPSRYPMNMKGLKNRWMLNAANPFLFYSVWSIVKTYLGDGRESMSLPAIPVFGASYLPAFRTGLTPFGVEYHLENYFRRGNRVYLLDIRIGDNSYVKSWGGVGLVARNIFSHKVLSLDMNLDLWKQPAILLQGFPGVPKGGKLGAAASLRGYFNLHAPNLPLKVVVELGAKSPGFLEGYDLGAGVMFLFGLAIGD